MNISLHASERFLQRVMKRTEYSFKDILFAMEFLEKLLKDVVPTGFSKHFVLPEFKNYKVVYRENTVITIVPKGKK